MEAAKPTVEHAQYLTFRVAGEECAVDILRVREILEYQPVTRVPGTPPSIRGVVNLRGSVVPVIDLAVKFGLPETAVTKRTCVVIIDIGHAQETIMMGVLAEAVNRVLELSAQDVRPPPPFGPQVQIEYLRGMGQVGDKFVLLLDIDAALGKEELKTLGEARTAMPASQPVPVQ